MNVTFVCMGAESLGLEYLSSNLKKNGHNVKLVYDKALFDDKVFLNIPMLKKIYNNEWELLKIIKESNPDLLGFSVFTSAYQWATNLAKKIKMEIDIPIIFGGPHVTAAPEVVIANENIDMICIGEGDEAIVELVNKMEASNTGLRHIPNIYIKENGNIYRNTVRPLISSLNQLPFPDKELFSKHLDVYNSYLIIGSRGCPYHCSFCDNNYKKKLYSNDNMVRRRSVENVISELESIMTYAPKEINFKDDIFTIDFKWLDEFVKKYTKAINIPFKCESHFNFLDHDRIKLLKEAGCYRVNLGLQSFSEKTRRDVLLRNETNKKIEEVLGQCDKENLYYELDHILGIPGEDEKDLILAAKFYSKLKRCALIETFYLSYYPATEMINVAKKSNLLSDSDEKEILNGNVKNYFDGGVIKDKKIRRRAKNYSLFFEIIPFLSEGFVNFIIILRLQRFLFIIGFPLKVIGRLLIVFKYRDVRMVQYVKNYFKNIIQDTPIAVMRSLKKLIGARSE